MTKPHILIVEDEESLANVLADYLRQADMAVSVLHEGTGVVETVAETKPDLVVLDLMLPGVDGLTLCRELRARSDVPILMQTAKVEEIDRLLGLELGADDYLCKPYSPRELVARTRAILRRTRPRFIETAPDERLHLDREAWTTLLDGTPVNLTRREFQILAVLAAAPGRVYSRAQLLSLVFPDEAEVFDRTIDSHIRNIRAKLRAIDTGFDPIRSVYGVGYAFEPQD